MYIHISIVGKTNSGSKEPSLGTSQGKERERERERERKRAIGGERERKGERNGGAGYTSSWPIPLENGTGGCVVPDQGNGVYS